MAMTGVKSLLKFKDLTRRLGITPTHTLGVLESIWTYCHDHATERYGCLFSASELGILCDWAGDDHRLFLSLKETGWMDSQNGKIHPHDYWDHAPQYVKRRIERMASQRLVSDTENGDLASQKAEMASQTPEMASPPNRTEPNPTKPINKPPVPPLKNGSPSAPLHGVFAQIGARPPEPMVDQILSLSGDPNDYRGFWAAVVQRVEAAGGGCDLHEWVTKLHAAAHPELGKDEGAFREPGKWLYKQAAEYLRNHGQRVPALPRRRAQ